MTMERANGHGLASVPPAKTALPELPHVTNNIVPLLNILRFHSQEAYKQLSRMIENLANTRTSEVDTLRKKKFLRLIVSLRQDFIKAYILVKWAQKAKDVSKLIDLLSFFRTQDFYFDNLGFGLNELNNFSGAKLPESDILTALEVLVKGRPQLPSYNYIERPLISPEKTLEVLQDLNLTLTTRMALIDDMPPRFMNNYEVKDGRVIITIPNEFRVSITVASDEIIESADQYYKSPFFFIDFAFLFGIDQDTSLITHCESNVYLTLPKSSSDMLETVANRVLLKQSLTGLYEFLHNYANNFKLYLISRQLRDLSILSKWRGNIEYKYSSSLIIVNYWSNSYFSRSWKSFIEIGIDRSFNLNFRWFKNGRYKLDHGIPDINMQSGDSSEPQSLSVDYILSQVINKHSEHLILQIYEHLSQIFSTETVTLINAQQILLNLTSRKSTIFAINPLTGFFYFMNPSPAEAACQSKVNMQPAAAKTKQFFSEKDMVKSIAHELIELKLDAMNTTLKMKLTTAEWIANDIIKLNDFETTKLLSVLALGEDTTHSRILYYRCRNWPSSWFLINMISGVSSKTFWWVARLRSIKKEWVIQWVKRLKVGEGDELNYSFFKNLSNLSSNTIIHHSIVEELQERNIGCHVIENPEVCAKFKILVDDDSNESILAMHNHGNLLPLSVSANTLFLTVSFLVDGASTNIKLTLRGTLKGIGETEAKCLAQLSVIVDPAKEEFKIETQSDLSSKFIELEAAKHRSTILNDLLENLAKMNLLIQVLEQFERSEVVVKKSSLEQIQFELHPYYRPFVMTTQKDGELFLSWKADAEENRYVLMLLESVNQEIKHSSRAMLGTLEYLKLFVNIFESIQAVEEQIKAREPAKLPNGLLRLQFDVSIPSLNSVYFNFHVNSVVPSAPKKILRSKIGFHISFKLERFSAELRWLLRFSTKENFNSQNLKYKTLFELIFKAANEIQRDAQESKSAFMKLNYDFVFDCKFLMPLMKQVTSAFLRYLEDESRI